MLLSDKNCYQALKTHDSRFDGQFFVGVTSTGIYCRPICTVKTPKPQNCRFFPSAAVAESHGFRPCLRCRPELAPGLAPFDRSEHTAKLAAAFIEDGFLEENSLDDLATHLNITGRHLRRIFSAEFGVSLVEHVQTQRLLLAKRLLTDTGLPMTEVALASGFKSLRRFNDSFRDCYHLKPSDLRKAGPKNSRQDAFHFDLAFRPPYQKEWMLKFLADRSVAGLECVHEGHYIRSVGIDMKGKRYTGWVDVSFHPQKPLVQVFVSASLSRVIALVLSKVKKTFDLSCDPLQIAKALHCFPNISGLRVPGTFDGFELAVRAILGQQVSVKAAQTLAGRIAARYGEQIQTPYEKITHVFPQAANLATCSADELSKLGMTSSRAASIVHLAKEMASNKLALNPNAPVASTIEALKTMPGIGAWTAQYIAMRALAWPDAFPHTDLGVKKALGELSSAKILALAEQWRPWRAYAVMSLWNSLHEGGA